MKWFKRSFDQQLRFFYLPIFVGVLVALVLVTELSLARKAALVAVIFLSGLVHWDLRDGGLISRGLYRRGYSYNNRNYVTVSVAFFLTTLLLAAANAFHTPLIMLYYIPIVLGALRGGHKLSMSYVALLVAGILTFDFIGFRLYGSPIDRSYIYLLLFMVLGFASGYIADRLRRAAVDLSALYETGRALNSTLNVNEIYALILNIVELDLTPEVSVMFITDSQDKLRIQAHKGLDDKLVKDLVIEGDQGLVANCAETQTPMSVSEARTQCPIEFAPRLNSVMAVPLRVGEKSLGVLMVGKRAAHAYGFENLRFLEALAGQAAISIQNAWLYRQTKEWASLDALTGIYNYRYFSERLDSEWSRALRYEKPLSLIMMDLDLFKLVNDEHGHLCGDEVLREVARLLQANTRETDITARYGGEEFSVILPETHYQDAYKVAEKLRQAVFNATFSGGIDQHIKLTISLGIANYPSTAFSKSDLIYQADQALYQAKAQRNTLASPLDAAGGPPKAEAVDVSISSED